MNTTFIQVEQYIGKAGVLVIVIIAVAFLVYIGYKYIRFMDSEEADILDIDNPYYLPEDNEPEVKIPIKED